MIPVLLLHFCMFPHNLIQYSCLNSFCIFNILGGGNWVWKEYASSVLQSILMDGCYRSFCFRGFHPWSVIACWLICSLFKCCWKDLIHSGMKSLCLMALISPCSYSQSDNSFFAWWNSLSKVLLISAKSSICHSNVSYGTPKQTFHKCLITLMYAEQTFHQCSTSLM